MPKPLDCLVPCIYCARGRNGEKSCTGWRNWKLIQGCFLGQVRPGYEGKHATYIRQLRRRIAS